MPAIAYIPPVVFGNETHYFVQLDISYDNGINHSTYECYLPVTVSYSFDSGMYTVSTKPVFTPVGSIVGNKTLVLASSADWCVDQYGAISENLYFTVKELKGKEL